MTLLPQCHAIALVHRCISGAHVHAASLRCLAPASPPAGSAPPETEDAYVTAMSQDVGMAFAGVFPDGRNQGEIEVFASRAGHVTEWHFDFMENFTFQISGRWARGGPWAWWLSQRA